MDEDVAARLSPRELRRKAQIPAVEARLDQDWDVERGHDLLVVDRCPFCPYPHYYSAGPGAIHAGAIGQVVDAHCRDSRRRNRADRKYLLVEASPVRARARAAMRALLQEQLGLNAREVDIAMHRGLEALLWKGGEGG